MATGDVMMNGVFGGQVGGRGGGGAMLADETANPPPRGVKRSGDDSDVQRFLGKRMRALSIQSDPRHAEKNGKPQYHKRVPSKPGILSTSFKRTPPASPPSDGMDVDSTRNRVYIADIDAELASSSSDDEERLIFLPDIEKRFNRLPPQVLQPRPAEPGGPQELVLYSDPISLSVDEGHDSVRKAVLEARQRAREKAAVENRARQEDMERSYSLPGGMRQPQTADTAVETAHGYGDAGYVSPLRLDEEHVGGHDPDAMDLG